MSTYTIIDEPKMGHQQRFIVNPVLILFASIFVPLMISLPFYLKWWAPALWLVVNGWLLGSPTKIRETIIGILGVLFVPLSLIVVSVLTASSTELYQTIAPYYQLILQGVMFFTLYLIVAYQSSSYSLHEYFLNKAR